MSPIFYAGLGLMMFGMGTVFVFLIALILATHLMSMAINKFSPAPALDGQTQQPVSTAIDPALLKVIAAAVKKHKSNR